MAVEVSPVAKPWNDDEIMGRLAQAWQAVGDVPADFIAAGKAAFAWRDIDSELAELVYDSALEEELSAAPVRAERAHLRAMTFTATDLTIEIEITGEALLGQVVPMQDGEVEVITHEGKAQTGLIDDIGGFTIRPLPVGPFRLNCRTAGGSISTSWLNI